MSDSLLLRKITLCDQGRYLIVLLEEDLTDTEFIELKNLIINKASEDSVNGFIFDLKVLDVIDSFTTRLLHNIALFTEEREIPMTLTGIKPVVAEVMKRQGLRFPELINLNTDVSNGISRLDALQVNNG